MAPSSDLCLCVTFFDILLLCSIVIIIILLVFLINLSREKTRSDQRKPRSVLIMQITLFTMPIPFALWIFFINYGYLFSEIYYDGIVQMICCLCSSIGFVLLLIAVIMACISFIRSRATYVLLWVQQGLIAVLIIFFYLTSISELFKSMDFLEIVFFTWINLFVVIYFISVASLIVPSTRKYYWDWEKKVATGHPCVYCGSRLVYKVRSKQYYCNFCKMENFPNIHSRYRPLH